jgi:small subunit ribosomal protein S9
MAKRSNKEESEAVNDAAPGTEQAPEGEVAEQAEPAADAVEATPAAESPEPETEPAEAAEPVAEAAEPVAESAEPETQPAEAAEHLGAGEPAEPAAEEEPVTGVEGAPPPARVEEPEQPKPADLSAETRYSATGKRKSSVARVILKAGSGTFELNGRALDNYFPRRTLQEVVRQPLKVTGYLDRVDVRARIHGGGISSQADALRHGIAKALIEADPHLRGELKRRQLLTRDPRVKERRKAGLKKARKRPQFSKR